MNLLKFTLGVLSSIAIVLTVLSFVRTRAWWVRIFDFPRAQIAAASSGLLVVRLVLANYRSEELGPVEWALLGLLALAVAIQLSQMLPYTRFWKKQVPPVRGEVPPERRLRIVVSNVRMGNRDFERWQAVVRAEDPDVVVAVEPDAWFDRQLHALAADYPHAIRHPQDNTYGLVVYSRLPLEGARIEHLVEKEVPSIFTAVRLRSGDLVRLVVLHPRPPRPDMAQDSNLRDAELVRAGREIRKTRAPTVIAGDLNDVAWSHTTHLFQRIAGMLDPRIGRGVFSTYHADHWYMRWPLDHVFHSREFGLAQLRRLDHVGSDHFPMLAELVLQGPTEETGRVEPPDAGDREEAADAVADAEEDQASESRAERKQRKEADQ